MTVARTIQILITGNADQAVREIEKLTGAVEASSRTMHDRVSAVGGMALIGLSAGLVAVGAASVKLADDFETSHVRLTTALKNVGIEFNKVDPAIQATNDKMERLGFTNAQTEDAMSRAVVATRNVTTAQKEVAVAADLARARHMDLNSALQLVIRAGGGTYTSLLRLGIVTKEQASSFKDGAEAVDFLGQKFQGQASKYADTFGGKIEVLKAQLTDLGVKIGNVLIPIIEDLAGAISDTIDWFERHKAAAIALAAVITTVLGAAISVFVYDKVTAFVGGIQRMLTGLGILSAEAETTAATVETSGATMAAAGAETQGGMAAAGAGAAGIIGPFALAAGAIAGVAYGLYTIAGSASNTKIALDGLSTDDLPKLDESFARIEKKINEINTAHLPGFQGELNKTSVMHKIFNDVLNQTPQYANNFIAAVRAAGGDTSWFTARLNDHIEAAEKAKVAQERLSIQMEIVDAKARGDAYAVGVLTGRLNELPTDKQIEIAVNTEQAHANLDALRAKLDYMSSRGWDVQVNVFGNSIAGKP